MDTWCEGCRFHNYPYITELPINIKGKYPKKTFRSDKDVWNIVDLLIKEVKSMNKLEGKSFDVAKAVSQQLPFFSCINNIYNNEYQKDISKYIYCKDFGVSPCEGSYNNHSYKWILKSQVIKSSLNKLEQMAYDKVKRNKKVN